MKNLLTSRIFNEFSNEVRGEVLGVFRIAWGLVLLIHALKQGKLLDFFHSQPRCFKYFGFEWVTTFESFWTWEAIKVLLVISAVAVLIGICFRLALFLYTALYLYIFLLDATFFNNHYYLLLLVNFLLLFTQAGRVFNLVHLLGKNRKQSLVPNWNYLIIIFQVIIVYVYGGLAKVNIAWLYGEPVRSFFYGSKTIKWPFVSISQSEGFIFLVSYAGILIDTVVPFLLLNKKTIIPGALVLTGFHLSNSRLFSIGIFPLMGITLLIPFFYIFFKAKDRQTRSRKPLQNLIFLALATYIFFQLIIPARFLIINHQTYWSEIGQKFSWRMMHRHKDVFVYFMVNSAEAEKWLESHSALKPKLTTRHYSTMKKHPWMILQYVRWLGEVLTENGYNNTQINVICVASVNQRQYQMMIDPHVDLTEAKFSPWQEPGWIIPLEAPAKPIHNLRNFSDEDRRTAIINAIEQYLERTPSSSPDFQKVIDSLTDDLKATR